MESGTLQWFNSKGFGDMRYGISPTPILRIVQKYLDGSGTQHEEREICELNSIFIACYMTKLSFSIKKDPLKSMSKFSKLGRS